MAGFTCEETERDDRRVYTVMRYVNSHRTGRSVYISSDRWRSMLPGWHKMWEAVKNSLRTGREGREISRGGSSFFFGGGRGGGLLPASVRSSILGAI
jgi:hypothetical protein